MSQTLSIGAFTCDPDMVSFRIHRRGIRGQTGRLNMVRNTWEIDGCVRATPNQTTAASMAEVDAKVALLEASIFPGIDLVFSLGSTMKLISSAMVSGTQIQDFFWLKGYDGVRGSGAEALFRRTFHLVVFGDNFVATDTDITAWHESFAAFGTGGTVTVPVGSLSGVVQAQTLQNYSEYHGIQSGYATGLQDYPAAPIPIYGSTTGVYYDPRSLEVTKVTPRDWGVNQNLNFSIRWSYRCWSVFNLGLTTPTSF